MRKKTVTILTACMMCMMVWIAACSSNNEGKESKENPPQTNVNQDSGATTAPDPSSSEQTAPEEITLTFFYGSSGLSKEWFMEEEFGNDIQKKFPHITVDFLSPYQQDGNWVLLENFLAAGYEIDIVQAGASNYHRFVTNVGLQYDLNELIKKHNYDLTLLEPSSIDLMKQLAGGEIWGLPYTAGSRAVLYNKDLFDKFGVDYPHDGMTWDELYDAAKRTTQTVDGINYRGFSASFYNLAASNQLSASFVDPVTYKVLLGDDKWDKYARNLLRFFEIPGNPPTPDGIYEGEMWTSFDVDKITAMYAGSGGMSYLDPSIDNRNFDAIRLPEFADLPGVGPQLSPVFLNISAASSKKDAAFQVLAWLTGEEFQTSYAAKGNGPVIQSSKARDAFARDLPYMQDRNKNAFLPFNPAAPSLLTEFNTIAGIAFQSMVLEPVAIGQLDLNTAFRNAVEHVEQEIKAAQSK